MRSRASNALVGLVAGLLLAACGTSGGDAAQTTASAAPAISQSTEVAPPTTDEAAAPAEEVNPVVGDVIDVRAKLVEQGFALKRIDAIETNSRYRVSPFQSPFEMSQSHVVGDGNVTCTFVVTNATWEKGEALIANQIFSGSTVRVTGSLHTGDGTDTRSIVSTKDGNEFGDVPFTQLTPAWIIDTFDLGRCGDLTLNGSKKK